MANLFWSYQKIFLDRKYPPVLNIKLQTIFIIPFLKIYNENVNNFMSAKLKIR